MRDLTAAMQTAVQGSVLRPVRIVKLDFEGDPFEGWTGFGIYAPTNTNDPALDGETFNPMEGLVDISEINENQSYGDPVTVSAAGNDLDAPLLRQVVRDRRAWRGRRAYIWDGLLNEDLGVIVHPYRAKAAYMTNVVVQRTKSTATVDVTIDEDIGVSRSGPLRIVDHALLHPSDTYSTFVVKLANKPKGLERGDVARNPQSYQNHPWWY